MSFHVFYFEQSMPLQVLSAHASFSLISTKNHLVSFPALALREKLWFEYNGDNGEAQRLKTKDSAEIKGKAA